MATIRYFEEIEAWQKARALSNELFKFFLKSPAWRDFGLKDQVNRSIGSVMDNIAEGLNRGGNREFIQFLSYSKGSICETQSQLYRMLDRNYIEKNEFDRLYAEATAIGKMLGSMMIYLKNSDLKGSKFHEPASYYSDFETRNPDTQIPRYPEP
jgi:four helix bundle protein